MVEDRIVRIRNISKNNKNNYVFEFIADLDDAGARPKKPMPEELDKLDKTTLNILDHVMEIEERDGKQEGLGYKVKLGYTSKGKVKLTDI